MYLESISIRYNKIHGQEKDYYEEVYTHRFQETVCQAIQDHMWKHRGELGVRKRGEHGPDLYWGLPGEKWTRRLSLGLAILNDFSRL